MNVELIIYTYFFERNNPNNCEVSFETLMTELLPPVEACQLRKGLYNLIAANILVEVKLDTYQISKEWHNHYLTNRYYFVQNIYNNDDKYYYTIDRNSTPTIEYDTGRITPVKNKFELDFI